MKRYKDQNIVQAWREAKKGKSFAQALEDRGYQLASGYTGLVVIDPDGRIFNPTRHLDGVSAKAIRNRAGIGNATLPDATLLSQEIQRRRLDDFQQREEQRLSREAQIQNRLQRRQHEERANTFNRLQRHIEKESDRLLQHYQIKEQREGIKALEDKLVSPSWWRRVKGHTAKDQAELDQLNCHFHHAVELMNDEINFLEAKCENVMEKLAHKHLTEREILTRFGGDGSPNHTVRNPAKSGDRSKQSDRDFDR